MLPEQGELLHAAEVDSAKPLSTMHSEPIGSAALTVCNSSAFVEPEKGRQSLVLRCVHATGPFHLSKIIADA